MASSSSDRIDRVRSLIASNDLGQHGHAQDHESAEESTPVLRRLAPFGAVGQHDSVHLSAKRSRSAVSLRPLSPAACRLQEEVRTFPVNTEKAAIMECLRSKTVTLVCGDTGSGKTTQMPQIASDFWWERYNITKFWSGSIVLALPT